MGQKRESLTHRTLAGMLWAAYGKVAFHVTRLVVLGILARLLTPADFGLVSAALVVTGLSAVVAHIGVGPALIQRPTLEPRHLRTGFTASLLMGLLFGAVIWTGAPLAERLLGVAGVAPVLRVLAWTFPIQGIGTVARSLVSRELGFKWLANVDVTAYGVGYGVVGIGGAVLGYGVWSLVAAHMVESVVRSGLLLARHPPTRRLGMERAALQDLLYFGSGFTLARLANYVAVQGDQALTGRYLGAAALGFYGRAHALMAAPAYAFGTVLDQVLFPAMAKVQHDAERLAAVYRRGVALIALLVLPASAVLILVAPELVRVVLGPHWAPVVAPFQVLGLGMLFRASYKMSDSIARSTGAVYRRAARQLVYAGLVCLAAWIGARWGITGVAWGSLAALTVNFLLMAQLSLDVARMSWREFWMAHRPAALLTLVTFGPVAAVTILARELGAPALVVLAAAGAALTAAGALLVWRMPGLFLGADGRWMWDTLGEFVAKIKRRNKGTTDSRAQVTVELPDGKQAVVASVEPLGTDTTRQ
jgi:PST family polysaccharide transporter